MKKFLLILSLVSVVMADSVIDVAQQDDNTYIITLDHQIHDNYGGKYPITYEFSTDNLDSGLTALTSNSINQPGDLVPLRSRAENFNSVEALRLEMDNQKIYLSVAFTEESDSLIIQFSDGYSTRFDGISPYYDNRFAVVTSSLDDVQGWKKDVSLESGRLFQDYKLWLTMGFITSGISESSAKEYQAVIDDGYIEIASHSRTHPDPAPYGDNLVSEISGNKQDLLDFFMMPELFRKGDNEYVYTWIAPNGYTDYQIDSLLGKENYLVNRLYSPQYKGISSWNAEKNLFSPFGMTGEIGNTSWGSSATTDTTTLKNRFDICYYSGRVYHIMFHPQSIDWSQDYGPQHLEYISGRNDVWYVALGHLYLYELMANVDYDVTTVDYAQSRVPMKIKLQQNYPNPFNPTTHIEYSLPKLMPVKLQIFNLKGELIESLVNKQQHQGNYRISWNASQHASGIYYYQLQTPQGITTRKCLLVK